LTDFLDAILIMKHLYQHMEYDDSVVSFYYYKTPLWHTLLRRISFIRRKLEKNMKFTQWI